MDTWLKTYGFSMEIIQEACSRTVLQTGQASFQYTDKILEGWKKKRSELSMISALWTVNIRNAARTKKMPGNRPHLLLITVSTIFSSESMILMNTKSIC